MFSKNHQISMRQTFRLFTYDLIGMSTLLLPAILAGKSGCDGVFAILIGSGAAIGYAAWLGMISKRLGKDFFSYCKEALPFVVNVLWLLFFVIQTVAVGGYTAFVFAKLMQSILLREKPFGLVLAAVVIAAGYAISGGLESRARIYEVLFWFLMLPLFLMMAAAVREIDTDYWTPVFSHSVKSVLQSAYLVFIFWGTTFFLLFLPEHIKEADRKTKLVRAVQSAVRFAAGILLVLYLILLGNFGSAALSDMDYPAVTFMSTVQITGGFLKRADALMLGIWFFTLFALLNTNLYYGSQAAKRLIGEKGNKRYIVGVCVLAFAAAYACYRGGAGAGKLFWNYLYYIGMPVLVIWPGIVLLFSKKSGKKKHQMQKVAALILCTCLTGSLLGGCSTVELEDRTFPMLAAVWENPDNGNTAVSYLYQPLEKVSDEMTDQGEPKMYAVEAEHFYQAFDQYEKELNKVLDYNHLKVLVLGRSILEDSAKFSEMLEFLEKEDEFPRNTYVCASEEVSALLALDESLPQNPGTYLEQLLENSSDVDAGGLPTLGNLFDEQKNRQKNLYLPYLTVQDKQPVQDGWYVIRRGKPQGVISMDEGRIGFLENGALKQLTVSLGNGQFVTLHDFQTTYDLSAQGRICVSVACEGESLSPWAGYGNRLSDQVTDYMQQVADRCLAEQKIDLSNSYKKLPGYNRSWYDAWNAQKKSRMANAMMAYEDTITLTYEVEVTLPATKIIRNE